MRILYAHRTRARDGSAVHIRALQRAFASRGHEVREVAPSSSSGPSETSVAGFPSRFGRAAREAAEYAYNAVGRLLLERAIRTFRPDLLYQRYALADASGVLAARRHRLPIVLEVNSPLAREVGETRGLLLPRLAARLERAILRRASRIAVVSGPLRKEVLRLGVDPASVLVTPNGVDLARFRPETDGAEIRGRFGLRPGKVLGFVGYLREWHRLDLALEAMARPEVADRGARLLVVGEGPARADLAERARSLGLGGSVLFAGEVPHEEVPKFLAAFDVSLLPAVNPYASPLKLFEYLAAGKPVVVPRQENVEEIVRDGREALMVPPGDARALASAIARLLDDPALRASLGRAARERLVECEFTWERNAARIEAAVLPLLRGGGPTR